jgi:hypothetical protein
MRLKKFVLGIWSLVFSYQDIKDIVPECVKNWFRLEISLRPVYDLYFAVLNSSSLYAYHQFLNFTQALESFHRRTMGGYYVENENEFIANIFCPLVDAIPSVTNNDHKNAIISRLRFANEFSQRVRLKELMRRCEPVMALYVDDPNEFIGRVVETRNYLTHFNKDAKMNLIFAGNELYYAAQRLKILLESCLLLEMGFPIELILKIYRRNGRLSYLRVGDKTK